MSYDILIIDDEKDIRDLISGVLEDEGYETRTAESSLAAMQEIKQRQPHLVILDVWLGNEQDGLKVLEEIKRLYVDVPVIMISGHATISTAVLAIKNGAYDFIEKPFQIDKLLITIQRAIETFQLRRENEHLKIFADQNLNFVGSSPIANNLRDQLQKAASNQWRVFLSGPSGSGKEIFAKEIHDRSLRKDKPFVVVNCAHIHPNDLEVELFGRELPDKNDVKQISKIGLVEKAHQGTIYFHQITALPLPVQLKITKLLTEDKFSRVGSSNFVRVNIRYMASSAEDMNQLIQNGDFREDLYYRINVLSIFVPKLIDRPQDLKEMVELLCVRHAKRYGTPKKTFDEAAILFLQTYSWPGNIAELKSIIDWTLTSFQEDKKHIIEKDMLPHDLLQEKTDILKRLNSSDMVILPIKEAREIFEKEYLQTQMTRFSGNISQTARFIGMERSALHRKLKILGLANEPKNDEETPL